MSAYNVIAIVGPTAVGKTALSLDLARALNAEVISVDSRQVYRYMDVGTDKVSPEVRHEIIHHMIDVADPDQVFTAANFVTASHDCVKRITARKKIPLFVGGTPFYYQALFNGLLSIDVPGDEHLRAELMALDAETLHAQLAACDPESAERLHLNDKFRVSRALEIYKLSGRKASDLYAEQEKHKKHAQRKLYNVLYIGLFRPRDVLVAGIEQRVRKQFASGYPEEVEWLLEHGYSPELPAMQGFGYKELVLYHQGKMTFEEAVIGDVIATRQFAKRQMTWFRKFEPIQWFDLSEHTEQENFQSVFDAACRHLADKGQEDVS